MVVVVIVVAVVVAIVIAVVVVCSRRPAPTVLGQVARLLAVSAWWCTRTIMVEVTPPNGSQRNKDPGHVTSRSTAQDKYKNDTK
ncbi:hypothetical protein Tco_0766548, partial [Tanacetum coccineum]